MPAGPLSRRKQAVPRLANPRARPRPSLLSRLVRGILVSLYRLRGWRIEGELPALKKFVLVGAPHTSNWDFAVFLGAVDAFKINPSYLGKHSLFRWPLRRFMVDPLPVLGKLKPWPTVASCCSFRSAASDTSFGSAMAGM